MTVRERGLLIEGAWRPAADGQRTELRDPATGQLVGTSAVAGPADVDAAVDAARRAAVDWARTSTAERETILRRAADLVVERLDDIADALTREQGKPRADSRKEILFGAEVLRYYAAEGRRVAGSLRPSDRPDIRSVVEWLPVGVVAAIVPWNYPVDLYCWKVAPVLAAGNCIIVKPPVESPLAAGLVSQCLHDAGLPTGVLADLPGALRAGERLTEHPGIDMITATASTRTGQAIMRSAAGTMKRLSLELGGHSPFVVLDDVDIAETAAAAARRSFSNTGQICIAVNRVLVADRVADDFVDALAEETRRIRLGHGIDDGVTCGPATTDAVLDVAARHVDDAVRQGATIVTGGGRPRDAALAHGRFYEPTVLDRVPLSAQVMSEETFGPVVGVHRVNADRDIAAVANATPYGLAAYVFGRDLDRAWAVAEELEFGGVGVNVNDVTELQAPFGGWKMSGFGRELGPEGLRAFMQQRHIRLRRRFPAAT